MLTTTPMEQNEIHFLTCSTVELQREELPSRRQGSNLQLGVYQTNVKIAGCISRALCQTRTDNFLHGKEICYQLHQ